MDAIRNCSLYAIWLEKEVNRLTEQEPSNKSWATVDKSKLPAACFLWVEDKNKKSTWHLPYREGAGGIENGMYKKAGPVNLGALRAISQAMAGARTGKPMHVPDQIKSKIRKLLKIYKIGQYKEHGEPGVKKGTQRIFESSISNQFVETSLDKEGCIIHDVAILKSTSTNRAFEKSKGRKYSRTALESVSTLINGAKAYINHATKEELEQREGVRDVRDLLGYYENGRLGADDMVRADLYYLDSHRGWLEPLIEKMSDKIGNSIHGYGDIVYDENSKMEIVEDINELASADLVTEPGSTTNLFESLQNITEGDDVVNYKEVSIDELKSERPDIVEAISKEAKDKAKKEIDNKDQIDAMKTKIATLEKDNQKIAKEKDDLLVEKKAREKEVEIAALIKNSGIKEEFVTEAFVKSLRVAENKEEREKLIEDRKKILEKATEGVNNMGDETEIAEGDLPEDWEKKVEQAVS
jgi:hypothetical protein